MSPRKKPSNGRDLWRFLTAFCGLLALIIIVKIDADHDNYEAGVAIYAVLGIVVGLNVKDIRRFLDK